MTDGMQNEDDASRLAGGPIEPLSPLARPEVLTELVTERLRSAILSGALGPGTHLSVPEIARRLGVSRTPAREGLIMLEREGLVEPRSSAGMAVITGGRTEILDLLDIREGLEIMTVRRAAERMDEAAVAALRALVEEHEAIVARRDLAAHVRIDARFHAMIRDAAGNARLARQLLQIDQQLQVLNSRLSRARGWSGRAVVNDHRAIAEAIVARSPDAAEAALRAHIERTRTFHLRSSEAGSA